MGEGASELTLAQLAARGPYVNVNFIWDDGQSGNLFFSIPFTDADGTARVQDGIFINLATLFEVTEGGDEDPGPGSATRLATETHDATFTAIGALTDAQAKALLIPQVIWVDADPLGGTDLIWTLAENPKVWVIDFTALFDVAVGELQGHLALGQVGNGGEITLAQLAGVNRLTVNFIWDTDNTDLIYTVQGSQNTFIVNLNELLDANQIVGDSHSH